MAALLIKVGGKEYPCRITMGAMLRYKQKSGKDVSVLKNDDIEGMILFIWCCVAAACNADGVAFDFDFQRFADSMEPAAMTEFYAVMPAPDEKKTEVETT